MKERKINMNQNFNSTKVITGVNTRWSYCNVWEPKSINGGTPKYSVSLIIPKTDFACCGFITPSLLKCQPPNYDLIIA